MGNLDSSGATATATVVNSNVTAIAVGSQGGANNLGDYIPVAVADITTFPGSDYYEIAVVQYTEKMQSDLNPTTLRGYVQVWTPKCGHSPTRHSWTHDFDIS
jgi:hypothetical protein